MAATLKIMQKYWGSKSGNPKKQKLRKVETLN